MHHRFAELPYSPEAITKFCKKYGMFCDIPAMHEPWDVRLEMLEGAEDLAIYEPLRGWYQEILNMRVLLMALELVRRDLTRANPKAVVEQVREKIADEYKAANLEPFVAHWYYQDTTVRAPGLDEALTRIEAHFTKEGMAIALTAKQIIASACSHLASSINSSLVSQVQPAVAPRHGLPIRLRTSTLRGAIYIALARDYSGETEPPRLCKGCGQLFTPIHGLQQHCGPTCRTRAYRRKQHQKENEEESNG